jgi:hypothetical protein
MREKSGTFRMFWAAFLTTLLAAAGLGGTAVALSRMENTMNAQPYRLFSLSNTEGDWKMTILGEDYTIEQESLKRAGRITANVRKLLPAEWESLILLEESVVELLESWIQKG